MELEEWEARLFKRVDDVVSGDVALDEPTRRRAALIVVDDCAAMVAAEQDPRVVALSSAAVRVEPTPEATHVTGAKSGRSWAAMVNAVAANWNELDEGYRPATCHGGLYALPAAMSEVEAARGSLDDLLRALVVGYEVSTAYARLMPAPRPLVLHPHATLSPVGAAAAVAAARGSAGPGVRAAVQVAVTLAAVGPFDHATKGILARNAWAGHGAATGFTAVEFAMAGIDGHADSPFSVLRDALGYPVNDAELMSPPDYWAVHDGYHKSYACCQYIHSSVEAALSLRSGPLSELSAGDVESVVIETHPLAMALTDPSPTTPLGGKFSVPHSVASVLVRGTADADTFSGAYLDDPAITRVRGLVQLRPYPGDLVPPHDRPSRVTITTVDGSTFSAECLSAAGGPDRPLSEEDVLQKAALITEHSRPSFAGLAADLVEDRIAGSTGWSDLIQEMWSS